mmetsp:Transcript_28/g.55  ORF Transcript_28/g.55 Transcript_28/m.55 type:complete len:84 (+) Transcript_28:72-323(+)
MLSGTGEEDSRPDEYTDCPALLSSHLMVVAPISLARHSSSLTPVTLPPLPKYSLPHSSCTRMHTFICGPFSLSFGISDAKLLI